MYEGPGGGQHRRAEADTEAEAEAEAEAETETEMNICSEPNEKKETKKQRDRAELSQRYKRVWGAEHWTKQTPRQGVWGAEHGTKETPRLERQSKPRDSVENVKDFAHARTRMCTRFAKG